MITLACRLRLQWHMSHGYHDIQVLIKMAHRLQGNTTTHTCSIVALNILGSATSVREYKVAPCTSMQTRSSPLTWHLLRIQKMMFAAHFQVPNSFRHVTDSFSLLVMVSQQQTWDPLWPKPQGPKTVTWQCHHWSAQRSQRGSLLSLLLLPYYCPTFPGRCTSQCHCMEEKTPISFLKYFPAAKHGQFYRTEGMS